MMIEHARLDVSEERSLYRIAGARQCIAKEARATMQRVIECRRMAPAQRDQVIARFEALLPCSDEPTAARQLDELDRHTRKVLKHLA